MSDRRHLFEPRLVNDRFGDPALFVDLGDVSRLPPRLMLRISHVFVSRTHMDHFAGFDGLLRGAGPQAYSWDVVHRYAVPLCLEVREIGLAGAERLLRRPRDALPGLCAGGEAPRARRPCTPGAAGSEHGRMAARAACCRGPRRGRRHTDRTALARCGRRARRDPRLGELGGVVRAAEGGHRIGYVTDLRDSEANRAALRGLLGGVDQLFIESMFLHSDGDHAARKNHLTAAQAGCLARERGARRVEPFHFSPRFAEVRPNWRRI